MKKAHVLIVGIDGVRYDSLVNTPTPSLDRIAEAGVLVPVRVHEKNATISGPVWSTVATGVYADRHMVTGNSSHPVELDAFPDFTARLRSARPELQTMVAASWHPLAKDVECGPIFSSRGWVPMPDPEEANDADSWVRADDAVADYAVERLTMEDLAASFVYFGEADVEAHNHGTGSGYHAAIERCDARLGRLLQAIEARPTRREEDWTVIVVTDHGHVDVGGHGGDSEQERTAWIASSGPDVPQDIGALCHADIAAQVLQTFGIQTQETDGVPFGSRYEALQGGRPVELQEARLGGRQGAGQVSRLSPVTPR
ncbi:alkaline phosphatase family protein [Paenarthrobacter sp. NPDC092416]|uniref:alkaline phosphatase family protein n=1 Tax=Paenarthrobacter sp. NPDC092416 TaxID=3364386 RepID=UPI003815A8D8